MRNWIAVASAAVLFTLAGCGGSSTSSSTPNMGGQQNGGGTTNPQGQLISPTSVTVTPGLTTISVDIAVPAGNPPLNAQDLGVNSLTATQGSAFNTGGAVARGTSARVLVFGAGLSSAVNIAVSGPQDIAVSNQQAIMSTDNTPGVAFVITVAANAAVGARTVILSDAQSNATSFTGGLEVF